MGVRVYLHGGGGPQVVEVTCQGGVTRLFLSFLSRLPAVTKRGQHQRDLKLNTAMVLKYPRGKIM